MDGYKAEMAIKLICDAFHDCSIKAKPTLYHSIRVGSFLFHRGYSTEIQIAGFLHDALEDTCLNRNTIEDKFGSTVLHIVEANSVDSGLPKHTQVQDMVDRCCRYGDAAIIVKLADIYDNFVFYSRIKNNSEIERCKKILQLVQNNTPTNFSDPLLLYVQSKLSSSTPRKQ